MNKVKLLSLALLLSQATINAQLRDTSFNASLRIINNLYQKLWYYYVEPVDKEKITRKAVDGMMSLFDPWSYFMSKPEAGEKKIELTNKYGGIGISYRKFDNEILVTEVKKGYPGDKAGIKAADVLVSANGRSFKGLEQADVRAIIMGDPGSKVTVVFRHPGNPAPVSSVITREIIQLTSVPYFGMFDEHIGYIYLSGMTEKCNEDVRSALLEFKKDPQLKGVILDLRENGGGYVQEANAIANLFIEKGKMIVRIKGRVFDTTYYTEKDPVDLHIPLVVLIAQATTSSAEILSGTLQDHDRAVFIGQRSRGKGMTQYIHDLGQGNQAAITWAYYYTPSGRCIQLKTYTDGIAKLISEAQQKTFKTSKGRTIKSNGAIVPDIETEPVSMPLITVDSAVKDLVFRYAIEYRSKHDQITAPGSFPLSAAEFEPLYQSILNTNFSFETTADKKLEEIKTAAMDEGYWDVYKQAFATFKQGIESSKKKELETKKEAIKSWVERQICIMYYNDAGWVQAAIKNDATVIKAKEILGNNSMYNSILGIK